MPRRVPVLVGAVMAIAGFTLALLSLSRPWVNYHVTADTAGTAGAAADAGGALTRSGGIAVFQLDNGTGYVVALLAVLGLLLGSAVATGRAARTCGATALVLAVAGMLLVTGVRAGASAASEVAGLLATIDLRTSAGSGPGYALAALPLLGLAAALLSVRDAPDRDASGGRTAQVDQRRPAPDAQPR